MNNFGAFGQNLFASASSAYTALQGNAAAKQTANETVVKLVERVQTGSSDGGEGKRASIVGLKSLARDWKAVRRSSNLNAVSRVLLTTCLLRTGCRTPCPADAH